MHILCLDLCLEIYIYSNRLKNKLLIPQKYLFYNAIKQLIAAKNLQYLQRTAHLCINKTIKLILCNWGYPFHYFFRKSLHWISIFMAFMVICHSVLFVSAAPQRELGNNVHCLTSARICNRFTSYRISVLLYVVWIRHKNLAKLH